MADSSKLKFPVKRDFSSHSWKVSLVLLKKKREDRLIRQLTFIYLLRKVLYIYWIDVHDWFFYGKFSIKKLCLFSIQNIKDF